MASENAHFRGRREFHEIQKLLDLNEPSLLDRHRIGRLVEKLVPSGERRYGENAIVKLTTELRLPSKSNVLSQMRHFALVYSVNDVKRLNTPIAGSTFRFSWAHVQRLIFLPPAERLRVEALCRQNRWATSELNRHLRTGRSRLTKAGAPLKRPLNVVDAILQVQEQAEGFLKRCEQLWLNGSAPAITAQSIADSDPDARPVASAAAAVLEQLGSAVEQLRAILETPVPAKRVRSRARN